MLIEKLLLNPNIFFICAYRDNEITADHPILIAKSSIKRSTRLLEISLSSPNPTELNKLFMDAFYISDPKECLELAQIIHTKTAGNPFYVLQYIYSLYSDKLIQYSPEKSKWVWDLNA